jgi:hypothetical protein
MGGMGGQKYKTQLSFFVKITFCKKVNSQTFLAILSNFFSMHQIFEIGGMPKSALTDLLSTLSTQN